MYDLVPDVVVRKLLLFLLLHIILLEIWTQKPRIAHAINYSSTSIAKIF